MTFNLNPEKMMDNQVFFENYGAAEKGSSDLLSKSTLRKYILNSSLNFNLAGDHQSEVHAHHQNPNNQHNHENFGGKLDFDYHHHHQTQFGTDKVTTTANNYRSSASSLSSKTTKKSSSSNSGCRQPKHTIADILGIKKGQQQKKNKKRKIELHTDIVNSTDDDDDDSVYEHNCNARSPVESTAFKTG